MEKPAILIVDDQSANLVALEALLEDFDVDLLQASSGKQALELLDNNEVSLVLLDVQMPEMDGYEVATLMRESMQSHSVPIIFVTAINRDLQQILKGYESGAVDFLTKPVEPEILCSKVRVFLELDQKTRELEQSNRALEQSLAEVERLKYHNELLLRSIGEGVISLDRRGNVIFANPAAQTLFGETSPIIGGELTERVSGDNAQKMVEQIIRDCLGGKEWKGTLPAKRQSVTFPAEMIATPLSDDKGHIAGVSIAFRDATENQRREMELRAETERDPLTGLCNRRGLERLLHRRLLYGADKLALLYLDLDEFKPINDRLGHQAGDATLKEITNRFSEVMRQSDLIARVGGDEFCILVTGDEPEVAARAVAEKVIDAASEPVIHGSLAMQVGASVGIALASIGSTPVTLMHKADQAMYMAKRAGGSRYQVAGVTEGDSEPESASA